MNKVLAVAATTIALVAGGLVPAGPASAAVAGPVHVNFTGDTVGAKPNAFQSTGVPQMFFYDTSGADLDVSDYGDQSHGQALAVDGDDASALEIRFAAPTTAISLAFGNDDPGIVNTSDQAELKLYRGATLVSQVDVNVNANDVMDQTIGYSGPRLFNRATFQYVDAAGTPKDLIEIVDDITINPLCTVAGTAGNNHLVGTAGNDVICGDDGADTISGRGGADLIYGGTGNDQIKGGSGGDVIYGGGGKDNISGGIGRDRLFGGAGRDTLSGGKGRDALAGGKGRDTCNGGTGHDTGISCAVKISIP